MKKDITPYNEKGVPHGCWERYWSDGLLSCKGNWDNGKRNGYWEWYNSNGELIYKEFYL
jgi:antitoxin component YwqK of YwqJK toxin-antitoxin module